MTTPESSENRETVGSGTAESVAATNRRFLRFVLLSWVIGYPLMCVAGVLIGRLT